MQNSLDPKNVFFDGFKSIQTKLEERFYTSVSTFSADLASVFSSVIGFATITDAREAHYQLNGVSHSSLTPEQKDKKKLAKRIIKAIQGPLEDATRKESELGGKPFEKELPNLEALLDQSLRRQAARIAPAVGETIEGSIVVISKHNSSDHTEGARADQETTMTDAVNYKLAVNGFVNGNNSLHRAHTPNTNGTTKVNGISHEVTYNTVIKLQTSPKEDTNLNLSTDAQFENITTSAGAEVVPALSNSGSTNPSTSNPEPLTPPRSEKDLLAPLAYGGIPWYVEPFDPVGTTIHDERWTGREVLRDMSEELSELDDDELNGLADPDDMLPIDGMLPETGVSASAQKSGRKAKKRWKGYK